jgi:multicomponent Na+:H+ antiporter subunit B
MLGLPVFGDPNAVIHQHVAPKYLLEGFSETGVPNIVTAILASYRGFDTLGEVVVIFTAGVGLMALLAPKRIKKNNNEE